MDSHTTDSNPRYERYRFHFLSAASSCVLIGFQTSACDLFILSIIFNYTYAGTGNHYVDTHLLLLFLFIVVVLAVDDS